MEKSNLFITNKFNSKGFNDERAGISNNTSLARKLSKSFKNSLTYFAQEEKKCKDSNALEPTDINRRKTSCPISIPIQSNKVNGNDSTKARTLKLRGRRYSLQHQSIVDSPTITHIEKLPFTIPEDTMKNEGKDNSFANALNQSNQQINPNERENSSTFKVDKYFNKHLHNGKFSLPLHGSHTKVSPKNTFVSGITSTFPKGTLTHNPASFDAVQDQIIHNGKNNENKKIEKKQSIVQMFENKIIDESNGKKCLDNFYKRKQSIAERKKSLTVPAATRKNSFCNNKSPKNSPKQRRTRKAPVTFAPLNVVLDWEEQKKETDCGDLVLEKKNEIKNDFKSIEKTVFKSQNEPESHTTRMSVKKKLSLERRKQTSMHDTNVSINSGCVTNTNNNENKLVDTLTKNKIETSQSSEYKNNIVPNPFRLNKSNNYNSLDDESLTLKSLELINDTNNDSEPPLNNKKLSSDNILSLTKQKLEKLILSNYEQQNHQNHVDINIPFRSNETPTLPLKRTFAIDFDSDEDDNNDSGSVSSKAYSGSSSPTDKKISVIENPLRKSDVLQLPDSSKNFKSQYMHNYLTGEKLDADSGIDDGFLKFLDLPSDIDRPLSLKDVPTSQLISKRVGNCGCSSIETTDFDEEEAKEIKDEPSENIPVIRRRKHGIVSSILSLDEIPKSRRFSRVETFQEMYFEHPSSINNSFDSTYASEGLNKRVPLYTPIVTFDTLDGAEVVADNETRDIISDSHDTISSCSGISRPASMYRTDTSFDKLRIDEEPLENLLRRKRSTKESMGSSIDSSCSSSTIHDDDETPLTEKVINAYHQGQTANMMQNIESPVVQKNPATDAAIKSRENIIYEKQVRPDENNSTTFSTMFGYFNYSLYNFISKEYGVEKWKEIISSLNLTKKQIAMFERPRPSMFDDAVTDLVLKTSSSKLNCNFNLFLQKFGTSYFEFCCSKYGDILKSIATNLGDFINNMDDIRRHIHKIEKIADTHPPSIYAVLDRRGTLLLYYYSQTDQKCLEHFLIGFIKSAAWVLYGLRSRVSLQQQRKDNNEYSIIAIKAVNSLVKKPSISKLQVSSKCKDLIIEPHLMDTVFPFHMMLNEKLEICQLGSSLNRLLEKHIPVHGVSLNNYFVITKPNIDFTYSSIKTNLNTAFILTSKPGMFQDTFNSGLALKGQMSFLESSNCLWFIASPKVEVVPQLNGDNNLYLSDIPIHDATRQLLLVNERTNGQVSLKNQLQVLTNRLKETSKELALGKINTENVLDEIFPKDVADRLMRNLPVPAVTAEEVTILFTDIVGFTSICEKSDPEEVTHMLNNLYLHFDLLCEKHEVYKVETIGDAYMAVGGLHHRKNKEHGRSTTLMGISMVNASHKVQTPAGDNIQIRVGIHSGSVVAGVVGTVMPRYCLFGNNVTLANKMESTSVSGKVQISPATYLAIKHHEEFTFFERPRDVLPPLMKKLHSGNSYFVSQRRPSTYEKPVVGQAEKKLPYMMIEEVQFTQTPSRKTSVTESVVSDTMKYPENLREQLKILDMINGYQNGKSFMLPRIEL